MKKAKVKVPCKCFSRVLSAAAHLPPVAVATPTHARDALGTHRAEYTLTTITTTITNITTDYLPMIINN